MDATISASSSTLALLQEDCVPDATLGTDAEPSTAEISLLMRCKVVESKPCLSTNSQT